MTVCRTCGGSGWKSTVEEGPVALCPECGGTGATRAADEGERDLTMLLLREIGPLGGYFDDKDRAQKIAGKVLSWMAGQGYRRAPAVTPAECVELLRAAEALVENAAFCSPNAPDAPPSMWQRLSRACAALTAARGHESTKENDNG